MEQLYAIIHKQQGLVIKIVQDVTFNPDGSLLLTEMPDTNLYHLRPVISELGSLSAQMVDVVKFDYDSSIQKVTGYYDEQGEVQEIAFTLDPANHFLLNNNSLYWRNNLLETS